jgi:hypothetical protein
MNTIRCLAALALAGVLAGCGQKEEAVTTARAAAPKVVTKWKHHPKSPVGSQKGIVIEMQGDQMSSATLYDLKAGDGFAIYSTIGKGAYVREKGLIIFSNTGNLQLNASEAAQVNEAVRWEVPFSPAATNLTANFLVEGNSMGTIEFLPFKE